MQKGGAVIQAYNAQIVVDADSQVIVAEVVTNQAPDVEHLPAMLDRAIEGCGQIPDELSADTGYLSEQNVKHCERRGVDAYIGVGRKLDESTQTSGARSAAENPAGPLDLCRCASSTWPVDCFHTVESETFLTRQQIPYVCSPILSEGLLANCRPAGGDD
jgi:hypothetical protein